ncbi:hypothetical protein HK100_001073 [Physocladia obscura]|uniref:Anti-proliferative protein domain-containing protein n=1 Tax=Physocladia obscura TaxID=109957 RepID=A0AAD5TDN0_9FUNG|nr:hypothetical protein HK100_001073 [Physocladia obscura]
MSNTTTPVLGAATTTRSPHPPSPSGSDLTANSDSSVAPQSAFRINQNPTNRSARRCLLNTTRKLDKTLRLAADLHSIPSLLVLHALPSDLALWIDPGSVVYRQGSDHAPLVVVWEDSRVAHQRLLYQHQITLKWSQDKLNQTPSPPLASTLMSPSVVSSPLLVNANAILPQKSKVVMKMPSSARATTSSTPFVN